MTPRSVNPALRTVSFRLKIADEDALARLAEAVGAQAETGDMILLFGDLGAGKSAFARALIRSVSADETLEVPSPTFTLVQSYETDRLRMSHIDLYRLTDASELDELGLDDVVRDGLTLVEWPDRAPGRFDHDRLEIHLSVDPAAPAARKVELVGVGDWAGRLERFTLVRKSLERLGYGDWHRGFLKGDASTRRYERLRRGGARAVLMDAPAQPDPGTGTVPYSRIAHLAENVTPFVAIARALKARGFSTPDILAADLEVGVLVVEDLGQDGMLDAGGNPIEERYSAAIDVLAGLHTIDLPDTVDVEPGFSYRLPRYDHEAFLIEISLLNQWFVPLATGAQLPAGAVAEFRDIWDNLLFDLTDPIRHRAWVLRDYHSPNLMWLPEREGNARIGIIDMQDAVVGPAAYDVASLVFDARVDIPERMWRELYARYVAERQISDPGFDAEGFDREFAILAVQRNTKILGIFARLCERDGKPEYLRHISRLSIYLEYALGHSVLAGLKSWYDTYLPIDLRNRVASAKS